MKALVIGATGATGKELVNQLIEDSDFNEVHIFVRKEPEIKSEKLFVHIVDFKKPDDWKDFLKGNVAFSCMGTTLKDAGSKEEQKRIDYDYQYQFAQNTKENKVPHFILVSAYGTNPQSRFFYPRIKGKLEEAIKELHFEATTLFKPGFLIRKNTQRPLEIIGLTVLQFFNKIGLFKKYKPLPTLILAKAMLIAAKQPQNIRIISLNDIFDWAQKKE